jgi:protein kinase domain-containing protein
MKEIILLEQMDHPGFIKLLGYCVRSEESDSTDLSEHGVTAVYEYGKRLNVESLQFHTRKIKFTCGSSRLTLVAINNALCVVINVT